MDQARRARAVRFFGASALVLLAAGSRSAVAQHFFAALDGSGPQLSYDEVELSTDRGCLGRLFFNVPDGIKVGQYWLNVNFGTSQVQVPFRILTKEEEKQFRKSWEDIKKQHEASLKK